MDTIPEDYQKYLKGQEIHSKIDDNSFNDAFILSKINSIQKKSSKNQKDLKFIISEYKTSREISTLEKKVFVRTLNEFLIFGKIKLKHDNFIYIINLGKKYVHQIQEHIHLSFSQIEEEFSLPNYIKRVLKMIFQGIWDLSINKENNDIELAKAFC